MTKISFSSFAAELSEILKTAALPAALLQRVGGISDVARKASTGFNPGQMLTGGAHAAGGTKGAIQSALAGAKVPATGASPVNLGGFHGAHFNTPASTPSQSFRNAAQYAPANASPPINLAGLAGNRPAQSFRNAAQYMNA